MAIHDVLNQRIRATKDESDDEDLTFADSGSSTSQAPSISEDNETSSHESQLDGENNASTSDADFATISFGALAKAQDSLSKRKRGHDDASNHTDRPSPTRDIGNPEAAERKAGKNGTQERARSSKHAPAEISSKKAVSRKREVVPTLKRAVRDPRFEPTSGSIDQEKAKKNYGFLNDYRDSEISELKSTLRQAKDPITKERLKRALLRMESRKKTQQSKDQEQEVLSAHRAKEKELIKQGKKPFYLKKADRKKLALTQRFEGMRPKQVDKVIERRRKKKASREMKAMPESRRLMDE